MKKLAILTLLLGYLFSCDSPQSRRAIKSGSVQSSWSSEGASTGNFTTSSAGGTTTSTTTGQPVPEVGYESCNLNSTKYSSTIGYFAICQNKTTLNEIKIKFTSADNGDMTCIVPTYRDANNNSTYIGIAQCTNHTAGQTLKGALVVNRPGYASYPVKGAMVLKKAILGEYYQCMDAVSVYMSSCNGAVAYCQQQAQAYMSSLCTQFKNRYTGAYVDLAL